MKSNWLTSRLMGRGGGGIVGKQETRWNLSAAVSENFIQAIVVREQAERSMLRESDFT